jgi:hypothetical protein
MSNYILYPSLTWGLFVLQREAWDRERFWNLIAGML